MSAKAQIPALLTERSEFNHKIAVLNQLSGSPHNNHSPNGLTGGTNIYSQNSTSQDGPLDVSNHEANAPHLGSNEEVIKLEKLRDLI